MTPAFELYSYFRSSCSARVRIVAHLKGIELQYKFVHLLKNEQFSNEYKSLNPSGAVPTMIVTFGDGRKVVVSQSVAIMEFLEEISPDRPNLLPALPDIAGRAKVRELVNIVACDIQPVTNLRVLTRVEPLGVTKAEWAKEFMSKGLVAFEQVVSQSAGEFCVGDRVSLADVALAPAVDGAIRFGIDMASFPTIDRIYGTLQRMEAFQKGGWRTQPDTPAEFRQDS